MRGLRPLVPVLAPALLCASLLLWTGVQQAGAAEMVSAPALPSLPKNTLVEYPAGDSGGDLVVILSGDGGWADLDRQLGERMSARGLSVVGFDCMKYFWETRSPDQTARDVNAMLEHYLAAWGKRRVVLIGFSFGAAVEPFILARMSEALRGKIALAVLLSANSYANWEIHWGDWLHDAPHASARPVGPELEKLRGLPTLCIYGSEEAKSSLCPAIAKDSAVKDPVELLQLPGGHHFDEDYAKLADLILQRVH